MSEIERIMSQVVKKHCGDYDCILPEIEIDNTDFYRGNSESCKKCAYNIILQALQEKVERENPKPLTVKQLEKMSGQAVFCVDAKGDGKWALVDPENDVCTDGDFGDWEFYEYAHKNQYGWVAYRYKPKHIGEANDMQKGDNNE